VLENK